jgi:hypothetical protein
MLPLGLSLNLLDVGRFQRRRFRELRRGLEGLKMPERSVL